MKWTVAGADENPTNTPTSVNTSAKTSCIMVLSNLSSLFYKWEPPVTALPVQVLLCRVFLSKVVLGYEQS